MKIKDRAEKLRKFVPAVCGGTKWGNGSNYTPPNKKKKRRKENDISNNSLSLLQKRLGGILSAFLRLS